MLFGVVHGGVRDHKTVSMDVDVPKTAMKRVRFDDNGNLPGLWGAAKKQVLLGPAYVEPPDLANPKEVLHMLQDLRFFYDKRYNWFHAMVCANEDMTTNTQAGLTRFVEQG